MPKKRLLTTARTTLQSQDKLAESETFEDRTRGALGPYWTLVDLCKMDLDDPVVRKFIEDAIPKHEGHQADLLELLKHSEEDREQLANKMIDYIENDAEIAMPIGELMNEDGTHLTKNEYGKVLLKYLVKELKTKF